MAGECQDLQCAGIVDNLGVHRNLIVDDLDMTPSNELVSAIIVMVVALGAVVNHGPEIRESVVVPGIGEQVDKDTETFKEFCVAKGLARLVGFLSKPNGHPITCIMALLCFDAKGSLYKPAVAG